MTDESKEWFPALKAALSTDDWGAWDRAAKELLYRVRSEDHRALDPVQTTTGQSTRGQFLVRDLSYALHAAVAPALVELAGLLARLAMENRDQRSRADAAEAKVERLEAKRRAGYERQENGDYVARVRRCIVTVRRRGQRECWEWRVERVDAETIGEGTARHLYRALELGELAAFGAPPAGRLNE